MKYIIPALIGILLIIPGINALPDAGTSVTNASEHTIILDIKTPLENEIISNDVVPPHIWVSGDVKSPVRLQSVIIVSGAGSTDCGNQSSFGCNVPGINGLNRITVTATDVALNHVSRTRDFTVNPGGPPQEMRITISGTVTTPEGNPIGGATIRLGSEPIPVTVKSETDGTYRINNAYGYHQILRVEKNGYINVTKEMTFNNNLNTFDIIMEPAAQPASGFTAVLGLVALSGTVLFIVSQKNRHGKLFDIFW